ncbi:unnamed protein product, partial [marine sediment metagenome]
GVRTQTFYEFWTPMKEMHDKAGKGVLVRPSMHPGVGTMARTPFDQVREYNYIVDITSTDLETGDVDTRPVTIASDVRLTKAEIEAEAEDVVLTDRARYGWTGEVSAAYSHGSYRPGARMG